MYKVVYRKQVVKFLQKQELPIRKKIVDFFDDIKVSKEHLYNYDVKPMKGFNDKYRLRIAKFRVVFSIEDEELVIEVIKSGSRGDIYK